METDLPLTWGEGAEWPSFIHAKNLAQTDNPLEMFDFWNPERTGQPETDYLTGQHHCMTAIAFAQSFGGKNMVANVIGSMYRHGLGPMERGFINVLASKATWGRLPAPIPAEMIEMTTRMCGKSEDEIRRGEAEGREFLGVARDCQMPDLIEDLLSDVFTGKMDYGALSFVFVVCAAAVSGARH